MINMASFQAKALYDFESVGEGELGVKVGDLITVTDTSVGQGWWYARAADGREGVVPEAYLEKLESETVVGGVGGAGGAGAGAGVGGGERRTSASTSSWADDWDSEEEHRYEDPKDIVPGYQDPKDVISNSVSYASISSVQTSKDPVTTRPQVTRPPPPTSDSSYNLLTTISSVLGKGNQVGEYLKGATEASATLAKEAIHVNERNKEEFMWQQSETPFTCSIGAPKKGSKFGGMKSFIAYQVTPSFSNIQVSRRYKHFDWLYERLNGKFGAVVAIPPLPDKQVTGRFEEDLIEHRRIELQSFIDRICRHPVLANSEVWKHFITQTDEKRWTQGKRRAEADNLVGISFLTTIQAPSILSETENAIDRSIGHFTKNMSKMDAAVRNLSTVAVDQANKYKVSTKKDYQDIGRAFSQLGLAVQSDSGTTAECLSKIGACYEDMSSMVEEQASKDWEPLQHMMHDYKGLVSSWQGILGLYNNMADKHKEILRDGTEKERDCSVSRFNTYRIGVQSEKNFFMQEVGVDVTYASQMFIVEQINYHRKMAEKLETLYHQCWPTNSGEQGQADTTDDNEPPPPPPVDPLNAW